MKRSYEFLNESHSIRAVKTGGDKGKEAPSTSYGNTPQKGLFTVDSSSAWVTNHLRSLQVALTFLPSLVFGKGDGTISEQSELYLFLIIIFIE